MHIFKLPSFVVIIWTQADNLITVWNCVGASRVYREGKLYNPGWGLGEGDKDWWEIRNIPIYYRPQVFGGGECARSCIIVCAVGQVSWIGPVVLLHEDHYAIHKGVYYKSIWS